MTIALKIGDEDSQVQGFLYLDAVTRYGKELSGKVTSFPVDSGGVNISDHFIAQNPKFTLEGVISDVDITGWSDKVSMDDKKAINAKRKPDALYIEGQSSGLQFLPSAVKQFFERSPPMVAGNMSSPEHKYLVEQLFRDLMGGVYYNSADNKWRNKMTFTTLYEMEGDVFINAHPELVITDVSFSEDADSGDALMVSISLEKVRLVTIQKTDIPRLAATDTKKKVSGTEKKGSPSTKTGTTSTEDSSKNTGEVKQRPVATTLNAAISASAEANKELP